MSNNTQQMAQQNVILTTDNFDVSRLVLEKPIANDKRKNVYSAKLKYLNDNDEKSFFLLQTPKLFTPFGANSYSEDDKYALTFTLGSDGKEGEFRTLLENIEKRVEELVRGIKTKIGKNSFTKMVKPSKEPEKYKPTFSIKLKSNQETGELFADVFNKEKQAVTVTLENITKELPKRSKVRSVLMMNTVWFVNNNCGITVNAKQMMVYPNKDTGCMFQGDLSDSEGEEEKNENENENENEEEEDDIGDLED